MQAVLASRTTEAASHQSTHRADIQGLRAIAVALVICYHAGVGHLPGGFIGVDVFFVISGYLIIGLIAGEVRRTGGFDVGRFWARRIRRLLPVSFVVLVSTAVVAKFTLPPLALASVGRDAVATSLYTINFRLAVTGTDYLGNSAPSPFQHYWSLATEEQFYVAIPLVTLCLIRFTRAPIRLLVILLAVGAAASFALCLWLTSTRQPYAFFTLPTRAWELACGGLLALVLPHFIRKSRSLGVTLAVSGAALIFGTAISCSGHVAFPGWRAAVPVIGAMAMLSAGAFATAWPQQLLSSSPLVATGNISYSLYLWHWPILVLAQARAGHPLPILDRISLVVAAFVLSSVTYRYVENPARRPRGALRRTPVAFGLGTSLTAIALVCALWACALPQLDAGHPTSSAATGPVTAHSTPHFVPSNMIPPLPGASRDVSRASKDGCLVGFLETVSPPCAYGDPSATQTMVLFGDSHADAWFPAVDRAATQSGFKLVVLTKSSCPAADVTAWQTRLNRPFKECQRWRAWAFRRMHSLRPAIVVVADYDRQQLVGANAVDARRRGMRRTMDALPTAAERFWLSDAPEQAQDVPVCLSSNLTRVSRCNTGEPRATDRRRLAVEAATVRAAKGTWVDTSTWLCQDRVCPVITGRYLMYRDAQHLAASYVKTLAPVVSDALGAGSH